MSVSENREEYRNYAEKYDVRFIFDDAKPIIDFYTIPWVDIFAQDSHGGFFATLGAETDMAATAPICHIDKAHQCFLVSDSLRRFLQMVSTSDAWRLSMEPLRDIKFYSSAAEAKGIFAFWEPPELPENVGGK